MTRPEILTAALDRFRLLGFEQSTIREAGTEAEAPVAFYEHPSKEMSSQIEGRLHV
jgi:hypothetical protein